jgi:5-methylcytosine-specific restriction endonuclease McrA
MVNARYVNWQTRMTVILRDKACVYCGRLVAYTTGSGCRGNRSWRAYDVEGRSFHFDHRLAFSLGGGSGPENIVLSCSTCNLSKGTTKW